MQITWTSKLRRFQSTLPARGATRFSIDPMLLILSISIHAPRTGSDSRYAPSCSRSADFNPRSPHGERPLIVAASAASIVFQSTLPARGATLDVVKLGRQGEFQSTLPARGATAAEPGRDGIRPYFNPRSPHGERHEPRIPGLTRRFISIHAPRTGSDKRLPLIGSKRIISIHAPRTGSDLRASSWHATLQHFNPRSPHGERRGYKLTDDRDIYISIHAPRTGSDNFCSRRNPQGHISIHAPRTGSDEGGCPHQAGLDISIHAPRTGSDTLLAHNAKILTISIHAPRTGSDPMASAIGCASRISIHAPRTGSDIWAQGRHKHQPRFQSTLPARGATPRAGDERGGGMAFQSTLPARGATAP